MAQEQNLSYTKNMDPESPSGGTATAERSEQQRRDQQTQRRRGRGGRQLTNEEKKEILLKQAKRGLGYDETTPVDSMQEEHKSILQSLVEALDLRISRGEDIELEEEDDNIFTGSVDPELKGSWKDPNKKLSLTERLRQARIEYEETEVHKPKSQWNDQEKQGFERYVAQAKALNEAHKEHELGRAKIESIEELAREIVDTDEKWATGEDLELIDKDGVIKTANMLKWFQEQMMYFHNNDPDNEINFFSLVGLHTDYRQVGLSEMLSYKKRYFGTYDKQGNKVFYEELADQVLFEAWLFNAARNNDANYRKVSHSEEGVQKAIDQMYLANTFSKLTGDKSTLYRVFTLAQTFKDKEEKIGKSDKRLGDSIRQALLSYYYISDFDMLRKILSTNLEDGDKRGQQVLSPMFNKEILKKVLELNQLDANIVNQFFNDNGSFKEDETTKRKFVNFFNVFNNPQKDPNIINSVKTLIKLSLIQSHGLYKGDLLEQLKIQQKGEKNDAKYSQAMTEMGYAEAWANSLTRWTGIAANNDYDEDRGYTTGHDSAAKTVRFGNYRQKQAETSRGGSYGLWSSMYGIKRLALDYFTGIHVLDRKDENGQDRGDRILLDVLLGRKTNEADKNGEFAMHLDKELDPEDMIFEDRTMQQFAGNHYGRAFKMLSLVLDDFGMKFDSFVTMNVFGKREFDPAKAHEIFEGVRKDVRYLFNTWRINWNTKIRTWEREKVNGEDKIVFKEMPLYEAFFGKEIIKGMTPEKDVKAEWEKKRAQGKMEKKYEDFLQDETIKRLHKNFFMYLIANEMYAHKSSRKTGYKNYDFTTFEAIYNFLEKWPGEIDTDDPESLMATYVKKPFFSKEEIQKMRKASGTGQGKLFWRDFRVEALAGSAVGMKKAIGEWFKAIFADLA